MTVSKPILNAAAAPGKPGAGPRFAIAIASVLLCGAAKAGCMGTPLAAGSRSAAYTAAEFGHMVPAVFLPGQTARLVKVGDPAAEGAAIVGLWEFEFRAKGNTAIPDGALIDFGTITWHEDGTEMTISGGRSPAVGDTCMGAWRQVGRSTFRLTHLAMPFGPPPGPAGGYGGLVGIQAQVTVDAGGDGYEGSFTLTQYVQKFDPTVPNSEFDQSEVAYSITGVVTGTRVAPK